MENRRTRGTTNRSHLPCYPLGLGKVWYPITPADLKDFEQEVQLNLLESSPRYQDRPKPAINLHHVHGQLQI